jgi:hypothetical protein
MLRNSRITRTRGRSAAFLALVVATALVGVAATPSTGAEGVIRGLFGDDSHREITPTGHAQRLVATAVADGRIATLWKTPTPGGGRCIFVVLAAGEAASA